MAVSTDELQPAQALERREGRTRVARQGTGAKGPGVDFHEHLQAITGCRVPRNGLFRARDACHKIVTSQRLRLLGQASGIEQDRKIEARGSDRDRVIDVAERQTFGAFAGEPPRHRDGAAAIGVAFEQA